MEDPVACKHKFLPSCAHGRQKPIEFDSTIPNTSTNDTDHLFSVFEVKFKAWNPWPHVNFGTPGRSLVAVCDLQSTPQLVHWTLPRLLSILSDGWETLSSSNGPPHSILNMNTPPNRSLLLSEHRELFDVWESGSRRQVRTEVVVLRAHSSREGFLPNPGIHHSWECQLTGMRDKLRSINIPRFR